MLDLTKSTLRGLFAAKPSLGVFWLSLGSLPAVEMAARAGADAIVLDLQHGLWDRGSFESAVLAAGSFVPVIARVADNTAPAISLALDAGCEGVLIPMIETADQAAKAVAFSRFPPAGMRSGGGVRPVVAGFGEYLKGVAERTVVGVMIETAAGVENAEAIAATPGLDFVLIGPGDLAISIGQAKGHKQRFDKACARVLQACRTAGIPCAIFTMDAEAALARQAEGYNLVVLANDIEVTMRGFRESAERYGRP